MCVCARARAHARVLGFFFFSLCHMVCGILVPRPGIKPMSPAVEEQSPNHWTVGEVLVSGDFNGEDHLVKCHW